MQIYLSQSKTQEKMIKSNYDSGETDDRFHKTFNSVYIILKFRKG